MPGGYRYDDDDVSPSYSSVSEEDDEQQSFGAGEEYYDDDDAKHSSREGDVSGLLHKLTEMESSILARAATTSQNHDAERTQRTQHVLRQITLLKVDLLTPGRGGTTEDVQQEIDAMRMPPRNSSNGSLVSSSRVSVGGGPVHSRRSVHSRASTRGGHRHPSSPSPGRRPPPTSPTFGKSKSDRHIMAMQPPLTPLSKLEPPPTRSHSAGRDRHIMAMQPPLTPLSNLEPPPTRSHSAGSVAARPRLGRAPKQGDFVPLSAGNLQRPKFSGRDDLIGSIRDFEPQSAGGLMQRHKLSTARIDPSGSIGGQRRGHSLDRKSSHSQHYRSEPENYYPQEEEAAPVVPAAFGDIKFPNIGEDIVIRDDQSMGGISGLYSHGVSVLRPPGGRGGGRDGGGGGGGRSVMTKSVMTHTREARRQQAEEDKLFDNAGYEPDLFKRSYDGPARTSTVIWNMLSKFITFPIPDACICKEGPGAKKAWREKVTIFSIFLFVSFLFVAGITIMPLFVCQEAEGIFDATQIGKRGWTIIHGKVFDMHDFANLHPGGRRYVEKYYGADASKYFPRIPPAELPNYCLSRLLNETVFDETNVLGLQNVTCGPTSDEDQLLYNSPTGACHMNVIGIERMTEYLEEYYEGEVVIPGWDLQDADWEWLLIDGVIYNVTDYIENLRVEGEFKIDMNYRTNERAYLSEVIHVLVANQRGQDASHIFRKLIATDEDREAVK
jgi:cytochrome b involved in lipid metabolism